MDSHSEILCTSEVRDDVTASVEQFRPTTSGTENGFKKIWKEVWSDKLLPVGWGLLAISAGLYLVPSISHAPPDGYFSFFIVHFGLALLYLMFIWLGQKNEEHRIHYQFIKLTLFLISAYALNRELEVFATSPLWLSVTLVALSLNYLAAVFIKGLPELSRHLMVFVYGVALVLFLYLSVYLLPLYFLSVFAMLAIGISFHTFIPLLFSYYTIKLVYGLGANTRSYWLSFSAGIFMTVLGAALFAMGWSSRVKQMNQAYTEAITGTSTGLPAWVQVAQQTSHDAMTEKVLKANLSYKISAWGNNLFWAMPQRNFGDQPQVHDPLVMIAANFSPEILLPEEDRIRILESLYNARHQALERLWSGDQLKTQDVTTHLRIWPEMRLGYTEKTITVFNHQQKSVFSRGLQEAIYTLHMPEGAFVTSLSLWINGKEEKGILTTKEKADNAYKTIVGVENRDPALVHWQEGNTVSVRVFPVQPQGSRSFKIGITAPLRKQNGLLIYENIWFDGPGATDADEYITLDRTGLPGSFTIPSGFSNDGKNLITNRSYRPQWQLAFKDPGLQPNSFSFNGYHYSLQDYQPQRVPTDITDVFLDLNRSWEEAETETVWKMVRNKKVWIYNGSLQPVSEKNHLELFAGLRKNRFSLFPFQLISDKEHSLVITRSTDYSPNLSELKESAFLNGIKNADTQAHIKLFQLGTELSPYLRSLKEFRFFDFESGDEKLLGQLLSSNRFVREQETEDSVIIHQAGLQIVKATGIETNSAPDHVFRLFAYNHIMQSLGSKELNRNDYDSILVNDAAQAYVVSPVSSLVVLETQADYERFKINKAGNSLQNASLNNKGAVPEPGEWALIILVLLVFTFFLFKWKSI